MITANGVEIKIGHFPDGTLLIKQDVEEVVGTGLLARKPIFLSWHYEEEKELLAIIYITKHFKEYGHEVELFMPYIPNARQDRCKVNEDVFTLKYFCEIINYLGFKKVVTLDPHSTVSEGLLDRHYVLTPEQIFQESLEKLSEEGVEIDYVYYPDSNAAKKYGEMISKPYFFGIKHRNWETGVLEDNLQLIGKDPEQLKGKNVLIIDDIVSYGSSILQGATKLKEYECGDIYVCVSHMENNFLKGKLVESGLVKKYFTTNSIFTQEHELVDVTTLR